MTHADTIHTQVEHLFAQGLDTDEIAAQVGIPASRVDRILDDQDERQGAVHPKRISALILEPLGGPASIVSQAAASGGRDTKKDPMRPQRIKAEPKVMEPKPPKPKKDPAPRKRVLVGRYGPAPKPIEHGTERGAVMHARRKEPVCPECREAYNATRRQRDRERRVKQGLPEVGSPGPARKPINHGTEVGYRLHKRRGEEPCAECHQGALVEWERRRLRKRARDAS